MRTRCGSRDPAAPRRRRVLTGTIAFSGCGSSPRRSRAGAARRPPPPGKRRSRFTPPCSRAAEQVRHPGAMAHEQRARADRGVQVGGRGGAQHVAARRPVAARLTRCRLGLPRPATPCHPRHAAGRAQRLASRCSRTRRVPGGRRSGGRRAPLILRARARASGEVSNSRSASSTADFPSTRAWCILKSSPRRPSIELRRQVDVPQRAIAVERPRRGAASVRARKHSGETGAPSPELGDMPARSRTRGSSTHDGSRQAQGGMARRWRNRGTSVSLLLDLLPQAVDRGPRATVAGGSKRPLQATCMWASESRGAGMSRRGTSIASACRRIGPRRSTVYVHVSQIA